MPRLIPAAVLCLLIALGSGVWYYYNAHVLNEYLNAKQRRQIQANYERNFKKYENLPQPKIIAVDTRVDIDPARRSFSGWAHYTLQNKTSQPISEIHVTDQQQSISNVQFDRPFHLVSSGPRDIYSIYALDQPLAPGETIEMTFNVGYQSHGFRDGNEKAELAYNGTFFDSDLLSHPWLQPGSRTRRSAPPPGGASRSVGGDGAARRSSAIALQSFHQRLRLDHVSHRCQHFSGSDRHRTRLSAAPVAARRTSFLRVQHGVDQHRRFLRLSSRRATRSNARTTREPSWRCTTRLATSSTSTTCWPHPRPVSTITRRTYSPYQFAQYRIMEFPRYRQFAQSFPNTVPLLRRHRLHRPGGEEERYRPDLLRHGARTGHQWWASPADRRPMCRAPT